MIWWSYFDRFLANFWLVWTEAAPWLMVGLIVSGLLKAWFPEGLMRRWLGGRGLWPVFKAAIIGTPVPLCSCSVLPAAIQVRREGASKGATVSFLIATPENGADSLSLSYILLGPLLTIARPIAAIASAVVAGIAANSWGGEQDAAEDQAKACQNPDAENPAGECRCEQPQDNQQLQAHEHSHATHDHATHDHEAHDHEEHEQCGHGHAHHHHHDEELAAASGAVARTWGGLRYAFARLLQDMVSWLMLGILLAAILNSVVSPAALQELGKGPVAMLVMLVVGVPMYICATASTPIAASLLAAGVSPGTALVFLLAGPATNLGGIALVRKELGRGAVLGYLFGVTVMALVSGIVLDQLIAWNQWELSYTLGQADMLPNWLGVACGWIMIVFCYRAVWLNYQEKEQDKLARKQQLAAADQTQQAAGSQTADSQAGGSAANPQTSSGNSHRAGMSPESSSGFVQIDL